jgi:hypothetical protein
VPTLRFVALPRDRGVVPEARLKYLSSIEKRCIALVPERFESGHVSDMKYRSFATLAALLAIAAITGSYTIAASARADSPVSVAMVMTSAPRGPQQLQLYAQANDFSASHSATRLDAQPVSASSQLNTQIVSNSNDDRAPLNLSALVVAGLAVMGSLALRRSPNK